MSSRVLVPVDGSEESELALTHALPSFPEEHVTLLHVIEPFPDHTKAGGHGGERAKQVFEKGQHLLDYMVEREEGYTGTVTTELIYGRPVHVIPRYVETHGIDEVVIGSRGRDGTTRLLLGSVAERLYVGSQSRSLSFDRRTKAAKMITGPPNRYSFHLTDRSVRVTRSNTRSSSSRTQR